MSEIFSIPSEKVKDFINNNNDSVILDVRTEEEWNMVGKPDGEALNAKTIFISLLIGPDRQRNENFTKDFNEKKISKKNNILIICRSGVRSTTRLYKFNKYFRWFRGKSFNGRGLEKV
jgi:rhodanese-related sulfurtransferase